MTITSGAKTSDWIGRVNGTLSACDAPGSMPAIGSTPNIDLLYKISMFPRPPMPPEVAAERYSQLKSAIVASGVPLLDDDELREELRSRRGDR